MQDLTTLSWKPDAVRWLEHQEENTHFQQDWWPDKGLKWAAEWVRKSEPDKNANAAGGKVSSTG